MSCKDTTLHAELQENINKYFFPDQHLKAIIPNLIYVKASV